MGYGECNPTPNENCHYKKNLRYNIVQLNNCAREAEEKYKAFFFPNSRLIVLANNPKFAKINFKNVSIHNCKNVQCIFYVGLSSF